MRRVGHVAFCTRRSTKSTIAEERVDTIVVIDYDDQPVYADDDARRRREGILGALIGLALLVAPGAYATPITVTGGKTVIFSFDFTADGIIQAPPYPDMRIETGLLLSSFDPAVDDCRYRFFGEMNGVAPGSSVRSCAVDTFENSLEESGWLDGMLSIALTVISGAITIDPQAIAYDAFGLNGRAITPGVRPSIRVVPEPWSIAVLLAGLGAMVLLRRGPVRAQRARNSRVGQKR